MSRKREPLSLSLFPFLAVLICTMGVLVALLLLVVKRAEQSADEQELVSAAEVQQQLADVELALAEADLRNRLLESRREEARLRLGQQRGLLGHLDNELMQLRQQAQVLAEQILAMKTPATGNEGRDVEQEVLTQQAMLAALDRQIETEKAALTDDRLESSSGRAPVYSIVPIAAQSGTNRRPIYIECREEGLYLHPGNIPLTLDDFVLPLTPGNPLDAALLAYREYWRKALGSGAGSGNAYPLMVVRPSGAKWYGVARRAMSGWDQEFGYELIPEDWDVNFGAADAGLVASVQQAIDSSLVRQNALVAYGQATPASYQASAGAGDSRGAEHRGLSPASDGGFSVATRGLSERRASSGAANASSGADPIAAFSSQFHEMRGEASGLAGAEPASTGNSSLWSSSRQTPNVAGLVAAATYTAPRGGESFGAMGEQSSASTDNGQAGAMASLPPAGARGMRAPAGSVTANGSANGRAMNGNAANGSAANGMAAESQAKSSGAGTSGMVSAAAGGSSSSPSGERSSGGAGGMSSPMGSVSAAGPTPTTAEAARGPGATTEWNPQAVAHQRGADWALPSRRNAVSAYHRPIRVQVTPGALILAAGEGSSQAETLPVETSLEAAIDPLANAIWRRVDRWGYLGFDGYWKPVLHLQYAPEQRGRAMELERLMEGSGLEVQHPVGQSAGGKR